MLLPVLVGACAVAPPTRPDRQPQPQPSALAELAHSIVTTPPLQRTHWGIEVYDPAAGGVRFQLNPEKHFIPASNTKLVVTAVALAELGQDFRYETNVYALGGDADDGDAGALVVVGRGDPTLSARFHGREFAAIEALADSVAFAGIQRIEGDLIIDATYFDRQFVHPAWEVGDLVRSYAAPVAAFAIEEGAFAVVVSPGGGPNESADVQVLVPPGTVLVENRILTDAAGTEEDVTAERPIGTDTLYLSGWVPEGEPPDTSHFAVVQPAAYAGHALAAALEARGIPLEGEVVVAHNALTLETMLGRTSGPIRRVATWYSPPLDEIVAGILKPSQNWIAEMLLKTLGAAREPQGSWRAGLEVEREYLVNVVGIDSLAFSLRDASGLSAQNLLTPHAIVQLLGHALSTPWGTAYRRAMAEPGVEETTLENRLEDLAGRVLAKTGTIRHVNALSGYVISASGHDLIFSILTNASGLPSDDVRQAMDRIVRAIARLPSVAASGSGARSYEPHGGRR